MSPEEKIEAAQKLIDEARAEMAAKKRNWLEEAKPGMLFRSYGAVVAIPPRHPVDYAISLDPEHIGTSCYGWEDAKDLEYLGHARDILTIALPPQVIEAHEPTGAELVGKMCQVSLYPISKADDGIKCMVTSFDPTIGYRTKEGGIVPWKYARLAR